MKLLFIRHSKTIINKNISNILWVLSEEGVKFSQSLSENSYIKQCKALYTSFQTKAIETTLILAKDNYIPIKPNASLTETTSLTNGFFENYETEMRKWHSGNYRINKGETKKESFLRFNKAIDQIKADHNNSDFIGIIAHANVLAVFSEQYAKESSFEIHHKLGMPDIALFDTNTETFELDWGSLKL